MYKIERNVPLPLITRESKYDFRNMGVGDSFLFPSSIAHSVRAAATHFSRRNGGVFKFTVRKVDGGNYRCWRTS